jgi:hypothetical protein
MTQIGIHLVLTEDDLFGIYGPFGYFLQRLAN